MFNAKYVEKTIVSIFVLMAIAVGSPRQALAEKKVISCPKNVTGAVIGSAVGLWVIGGPVGLAAGGLIGANTRVKCTEEIIDGEEIYRRTDNNKCYYRDGRRAPCPDDPK